MEQERCRRRGGRRQGTVSTDTRRRLESELATLRGAILAHDIEALRIQQRVRGVGNELF